MKELMGQMRRVWLMTQTEREYERVQTLSNGHLLWEAFNEMLLGIAHIVTWPFALPFRLLAHTIRQRRLRKLAAQIEAEKSAKAAKATPVKEEEMREV